MSADEHLTREIMGNIPMWLAVMFYLTSLVACGWAILALIRRFRQHRRGRQALYRETSGWVATVASLLRYLTFHRQLLRDRFAGVAHLLIFYGFFILFIGTCMVFLEHDTPLHFFYGRFYLVASLIIDLGGVAFLIGLLMFLYRRLFGNSPRILRRFYVSALLWLLLAITVTGFLLEGARIAVDRPDFERWSVAGYAIGLGLNAVDIKGDAALRLHRFCWVVHAILCVAFFGLLPWRFFSHVVYSAVSWALRTRRPCSTLRAVDLGAQTHSPQVPGASNWQDLTWIDLLQADACTTCGRCNEVCPAHTAGKPLHPRDVVLGIREAMDLSESQNLQSLINADVLWSCTTCGACNNACPVGIEVYDKIVEIRRGAVEAGVIPTAASACFESCTDEFNPFRKANADRMNWASGLNVPVAEEGRPIELLYWVGCAGSFDPDGRSVSRSMIKILNHLGVSYRVLGTRERCTGDPARRMGEEGLFQELAQDNIATLNNHGVRRILTHCPHCFNSFRNEYPQVNDVSFEVEHHTQFLARMIAEGKLKVSNNVDQKVTFHDPCYLGRGNNETQAPRRVLSSLPQLAQVEMPHHGRESFCCGAGGGSMWIDVRGENRVENIRAQEAADTGADTVVTGCPFCKGMLIAGRESLEREEIGVCDVSELVVQAEGL